MKQLQLIRLDWPSYSYLKCSNADPLCDIATTWFFVVFFLVFFLVRVAIIYWEYNKFQNTWRREFMIDIYAKRANVCEVLIFVKSRDILNYVKVHSLLLRIWKTIKFSVTTFAAPWILLQFDYTFYAACYHLREFIIIFVMLIEAIEK